MSRWTRRTRTFSTLRRINAIEPCAALMNTGPESGIHKSVDGGETWTELTIGLPEATRENSLEISPQKPNVVYATIELAERKGGVLSREDFGASFTKMSDYVGGGTGPHYYQEIFLPARTSSTLSTTPMCYWTIRRRRKEPWARSKSTQTRRPPCGCIHPNGSRFRGRWIDGGLYRSLRSRKKLALLPPICR